MQAVTKISNQISNLCAGLGLIVCSAVAAGSIPQIASAEPMFSISTTNVLARFDTDAPEDTLYSVTVTGLQSSETILGMDFRPSNNRLYALGSTSRVYTIDTITGVATILGSQFSPALTGTAFGFDFNPINDRIRIVSDTEENLRVNPDTGGLLSGATDLAYDAGDSNVGVNPNVVCAAYNNNFNGALVSTLFAIDSNLDALVLQGSEFGSPSGPNSGLLFTEGLLAVNTSAQCGMDSSGLSGAMFASLTSPTTFVTSLYRIDLGTGNTMVPFGVLGSGSPINDIAVPFEETTAPTATITTPSRASIRTSRSRVTVSGTATDNIGVSSIQLRTRTNGRVRAFRTISTTTSWTSSISIPARSRVVVDVKAIDVYGNESALDSVTITRN